MDPEAIRQIKELDRVYGRMVRQSETYILRLPVEDQELAGLWQQRLAAEGTTIRGKRRRNEYMHRLVFGMKNAYLPRLFRYEPPAVPLMPRRQATAEMFADIRKRILREDEIIQGDLQWHTLPDLLQ